MSWEIIFVLGLLVCTVVSFALEKIPTDQTAILAITAILVAGLLPMAKTLPDTAMLLGVLTNPAPLTIAAMFVISAALEKCGAIEILAVYLGKLATIGYRRFLLVLVLGVAVISAFVNNTPVVVVFLPVVLSLSRQLKVPASKLLIPLSYASIFGGTCTLVGTSTNLLGSSIIEQAGHPPLAMFELASIGVPLLLIGTVYLLIFGNRLLPNRESLTSILSEEERKEYLTEAFVKKGSPLAGISAGESDLLKRSSVRILEIIRNEVALPGNLREVKLRESDRLILACRPSGFAHARSVEGLDLGMEIGLGLETIAAHEGSIVEGVIGPRSTITGKTISELHFRQRFRMIILAIHRKGINLRDTIDELTLKFGDTVLMMGTDQAIEQLRTSDDVLLLDRPATPAKSLRRKMPLVLTILAGVVAIAALTPAPIVATALTGCALVFATGCLKPDEGYASIEWSIIMLIYGMLGLGLAMQTTGAAQLLANALVGLADATVSDPLKPYILLAALYLCTSILTEMLSNNATIVLMAPLAIGMAETLGVDPRPFIVAACIASSASFTTPIGYQTNTYVYGVGGYKFADFFKIGLPLNLIYFSVSVVLIPRIWSF